MHVEELAAGDARLGVEEAPALEVGDVQGNGHLGRHVREDRGRADDLAVLPDDGDDPEGDGQAVAVLVPDEELGRADGPVLERGDDGALLRSEGIALVVDEEGDVLRALLAQDLGPLEPGPCSAPFPQKTIRRSLSRQ